MNASDVIAARYRLERLLGTGGLSEVWLAEDQRLGRWVAVKLLKGAGPDSTLEREARLVAGLHHSNIAAVYDTGVHEGQPYLVMEYVHGLSLRDLMAERGGRLSEREAVRYAIQVAGALDYAHRQGVIHCDVKPENILVTEDGIAKTVDFGIAETLSRTLSPQEAREIMGTIPYLAPEVIQGSPPSPRSDLYSLGLTLYELISGRLPFSGANGAAVAGQRLAAAAPPIRTFAHSASADLERVLARALAITPADRFADVTTFARELSSLAEPFAATAPTQPTPRIVVRRQRPRAFDPPPARRNTARIAPAKKGSSGVWLLGVIVAGAVAVVIGAAALAVGLTRGGDGENVPSPTATPTPRPSPPMPPRTATARASETPTATASPSPTTTTSPTATQTATPTRTASPPATATSTRTPGTPTPGASSTPATPATATRTP